MLGPARAAGEWAALFPDATVYDERTLLGALMLQTTPTPSGWIADDTVEAWSLVEGAPPGRAVESGVAMPLAEAVLRPNPLLGRDGVKWPSARYRDEYAAGCLWALPDDGLRELVGAAPLPAPVRVPDDARLRRVVDLPERW